MRDVLAPWDPELIKYFKGSNTERPSFKNIQMLIMQIDLKMVLHKE